MFFFEELWVAFQYVGYKLHGIVDVILKTGERKFNNRSQVYELFWYSLEFRLCVEDPALR